MGTGNHVDFDIIIDESDMTKFVIFLGNLKSKRRLNRMANLKAIVSVNPKVQFVVTESGGLNQLY